MGQGIGKIRAVKDRFVQGSGHCRLSRGTGQRFVRRKVQTARIRHGEPQGAGEPAHWHRAAMSDLPPGWSTRQSAQSCGRSGLSRSEALARANFPLAHHALPL